MPSKPPPKPILKLSDISRLRPEDEHRQQISDEIAKGSDRAAALLAVSELDQILEDVIMEHFREDLTEEERNELFSGMAPLATFGAKI